MIISVIIPVYNVELYVERCIRSVMNQIKTTNFECIIVDDCGSDRSMEIVRTLLNSYDGDIIFKILQHKGNRGLSAARNTGISEAKGQYLYFLDSDDEILPDTIYLFEEYIRQYPKIDCVVGDIYASYPFSKWIRVKNNGQFFIEGNSNVQKMMLKRVSIPVTAWNKAIRKDLIIENNLYFKEGFIHEDEIWSYFLSRHIQTYGFIDCATYIYFQNPNSIISNRYKSITNKIRILSLFVEDLHKDDIYTRYRLITEWILNLYSEIMLLDSSQRNQIDYSFLYSLVKNFYKKSIKRGYIHIAIFLSPYMINIQPSKFKGYYLSKLFSKALRIL